MSARPALTRHTGGVASTDACPAYRWKYPPNARGTPGQGRNPRASPNTAVATRKFHINPALAEVHAQIALLQIRGTPELGEPGEWMCWRPGEESFEHVARAAR